MINLVELNESDIDNFAQQLAQISAEKDEADLLRIIGNALHDSGLAPATDASYKILVPKMYNEVQQKFNIARVLDFVADTEPLSAEQAEVEGNKFFQRFNEKLKATICSDVKIIEAFQGADVKNLLITIIPLIVAALGITLLNPLALALIATVLAYLLKVGFDVYCETA